MTKDEILFWAKTISISLDVYTLYTDNINEIIKWYEENPFYNYITNYGYENFIDTYIKCCEEKNIYYINTPLKFYYVVLCLDKKTNKHLIIGPCIEEHISEETLNDLKNKLNLKDSFFIELKKYYATLPAIERNKLWALCNVFLERYFKIEGPFSFIKIGENHINNALLNINDDINNDIPIKMIEERYKSENEFLGAVSKGDFPTAYLHYEKMMSNMAIYYNFDDRGTKARGITILSTLLRKAAQEGGVHPLHLENISSKYTLISLSKFKLDEGINIKMIKDYCALVKEHSLKNISPLSRDAVNYIHFNLNSNLTVSNIADYLCITPNYLYRIFKKEFNISVIDYINQKRIKESIKLIKKTDMQVQQIAEKVGFNDISYFCRVFKQQLGKSPSKYKNDLGKK